MVTKKDRRHSGRTISKIYHPEKHPYEEVHWNDWTDFRDGVRDWPSDRTRLRKWVERNAVCVDTCGISENNWCGYNEICFKCIQDKVLKLRDRRKAMKNEQ